MSIVTIEDTNLTNIANAIRNKNKETVSYKPSEMASAIQGIQTGIEPTGTLDITENGTYDVTEYANANVNVPTGGGTVEKGLVINAYDSNGFPTDVSIVGMNEIPALYLYDSGYTKTIGGQRYASYLSKVKNWTLPNNLRTISQYAFYNCTLNLTELPDTLTSIQEYAFYGNSSLKLNKLPKDLNIYQTTGRINQYTFYNCMNLQIKELNQYVKYIDQYAFYGCQNLTELTLLHTSIGMIGASSFWNCYRLTKFIMPNITSVPTLSNVNAFNNTPLKGYTSYTDGVVGYFYVPDNLVNSFKSASNWSTLADYIKGISELPVEG